MEKPLSGITVLDISRMIAGPTCCMHLGDLGADVIRIEPIEGDFLRKIFPFSTSFPEGRLFTPFNRNKRCMALNIFSEKGKSIFLELLLKADVLVQNYRPGIMEKANLGYTSLHELYPRLIYCSISGYDPKGPNKNRAGYDFAVQADSGLMSTNGEIGRDPVKIAVPLIDLHTGMIVASGINAALLSRERDGKGRHVETSLFAVAVSLLAERSWAYVLTGEIPKRSGNQSLVKTVVSDYFPTQDGGVILTISSQKMWENLCEIPEFSSLDQDGRFSSLEVRQANIEDLRVELKRIFPQNTSLYWVEKLAKEKGLVCASVRNLDEVFADPEIEACRMVKRLDHPVYGEMNAIGIPLSISDCDLDVELPPPAFAAHTDKILKSYIGMSESQIHQLRDEGVIA